MKRIYQSSPSQVFSGEILLAIACGVFAVFFVLLVSAPNEDSLRFFIARLFFVVFLGFSAFLLTNNVFFAYKSGLKTENYAVWNKKIIKNDDSADNYQIEFAHIDKPIGVSVDVFNLLSIGDKCNLSYYQFRRTGCIYLIHLDIIEKSKWAHLPLVETSKAKDGNSTLYNRFKERGKHYTVQFDGYAALPKAEVCSAIRDHLISLNYIETDEGLFKRGSNVGSLSRSMHQWLSHIRVKAWAIDDNGTQLQINYAVNIANHVMTSPRQYFWEHEKNDLITIAHLQPLN